jgi:AcrR family transcriptional regulator
MQAQTAPLPLILEGPPSDYRQRLVVGLINALAQKPYSELTIADVVREARVSKRTFYEHFPDKEACFLAAYQAISAALLERIAQAAAGVAPGEPQLRATTEAYFSALESEQPLLRAFLSEIHAVGPAALAMRRTIHGRFAELLRALAEGARRVRSDIHELSPELASALVGGINELVLMHASEGTPEQLTRVRAAAVELIRRTLFAPTAG